MRRGAFSLRARDDDKETEKQGEDDSSLAVFLSNWLMQHPYSSYKRYEITETTESGSRGKIIQMITAQSEASVISPL
jgi:hypothetical protein